MTSLTSFYHECQRLVIFTGASYAAREVVNGFMKWTSLASFFKKASLLDVRSTVACSVLFVVINDLAHKILSSIVPPNMLQEPLVNLGCIGISTWATFRTFNLLAPCVQWASIEMQPVASIIAVAILIYTHVISSLGTFNQRPLY